MFHKKSIQLFNLFFNFAKFLTYRTDKEIKKSICRRFAKLTGVFEFLFAEQNFFIF